MHTISIAESTYSTSTTTYVIGYTHSVYNVCDHWVHN